MRSIWDFFAFDFDMGVVHNNGVFWVLLLFLYCVTISDEKLLIQMHFFNDGTGAHFKVINSVTMDDHSASLSQYKDNRLLFPLHMNPTVLLHGVSSNPVYLYGSNYNIVHNRPLERHICSSNSSGGSWTSTLHKTKQKANKKWLQGSNLLSRVSGNCFHPTKKTQPWISDKEDKAWINWAEERTDL